MCKLWVRITHYNDENNNNDSNNNTNNNNTRVIRTAY